VKAVDVCEEDSFFKLYGLLIRQVECTTKFPTGWLDNGKLRKLQKIVGRSALGEAEGKPKAAEIQGFSGMGLGDKSTKLVSNFLLSLAYKPCEKK
jgi:hypothetical protein